ncbi:hypothetical protein J6590_061682 [Homalodisca vitripennis]|nr:hypothetical protein J6590_061682 [Homalodisca vitripennis]
MALTERGRATVLMMRSYGDRVSSYCEVRDLFDDTERRYRHNSVGEERLGTRQNATGIQLLLPQSMLHYLHIYCVLFHPSQHLVKQGMLSNAQPTPASCLSSTLALYSPPSYPTDLFEDILKLNKEEAHFSTRLWSYPYKFIRLQTGFKLFAVSNSDPNSDILYLRLSALPYKLLELKKNPLDDEEDNPGLYVELYVGQFSLHAKKGQELSNYGSNLKAGTLQNLGKNNLWDYTTVI